MKTVRSPFGLLEEAKSGQFGEYSKTLVDECILLFKEENGIALSREEAGQFLDSLGGLFLAFVDMGGVGGRAQPATSRPFGRGDTEGSSSTGVRNTGGTLPIAI